MTIKRAIFWVSLWVTLAIAFNIGVYFMYGTQKALEFFGGYIIELSLSIDNLFVFLMVFAAFGIKQDYQRRVLQWGIIGAVVLRLMFILAGISIVNKFHWVLYIFGLILIVSGIKMFKDQEQDECVDYSQSKTIKLLKRIIPVSDNLHEEKFFVRVNGVLHATPLFAILIIIEGADLLFNFDSIPAIFAITRDTMIVFTSNVFAILGLRSLYFVLERLHNSFRFVKYGVAILLMFTGVKLSILFFHIEIPLVLSIGLIIAILVLSIVLSVFIPVKQVECEISPAEK